MKRKYVLPVLTLREKQRLEEVKFYLLVSRISKKSCKVVTRYSYVDMLNMFAELTEVDPIALENMAVFILKPANKPSIEEIALAARYQGLPYRFIDKYFVNMRKLYETLDNFIVNRNKEDGLILEPRFDDQFSSTLIQFNTEFTERLYPAFYVLSRPVVEDQNDEKDNW